MRSFYKIFFLIFTLSSVSFTQTQIGVKTGLNIASLNFSGNPFDSKLGFTGGAFFRYQFSEMFALQSEIYYTMKGATDKFEFLVDTTFSTNTVDLTISYNYLEVPVLVMLMIPIQDSYIKPTISAGPFIGLNLTSKVKRITNGESEENDQNDVRPIEFGLQFGGGIGFMVGRNELGLEFRYIFSLISIIDDGPDIKNNVINFNLYFGFSLQ